VDYSEWQNCTELLKTLFSVPVADDGGTGDYAGQLPDSADTGIREARKNKKTDIEGFASQLATLLDNTQWFLTDTSQLADILSRRASEEQASTLYSLIASHDENDLEQIVVLFQQWVTGWLEPDPSS
jgi:hypothetical protein